MAHTRKPWREVRAEMEFEKYLELRKLNQKSGGLMSDRKMRDEARRYANNSCRLAIRQRNENLE